MNKIISTLVFVFFLIIVLFAGQRPEKVKDPQQEINNEYYDMNLNRLGNKIDKLEKEGINTQTIINKTTGKAIDIEKDTHGNDTNLNVQDSLNYLEDNKVNNFGDDMSDWLNFTSTAMISGLDKSSNKWNFQISTVTTTQSILEMYHNTGLGAQQNSLILDTTTEFNLGTLSGTQVNTSNISLAKTDTTNLITDVYVNTTDNILSEVITTFFPFNLDDADWTTTQTESGGWWTLISGQWGQGYGRIIFDFTKSYQEINIVYLGECYGYTRITFGSAYASDGIAINYGDTMVPETAYKMYIWKDPNINDRINYHISTTSSVASRDLNVAYNLILKRTGTNLIYGDASDGNLYSQTITESDDKLTYTYRANNNSSEPAILGWSEKSSGYISTGTYNYVYDSGIANSEWVNFVSSHSQVSGTTDIHYRFRTSANNTDWTSWSNSINTEEDFTYSLTLTNNRYIEVEATFHSPNHQSSALISTMYFQHQISNILYNIRYIGEDVQSTGGIDIDGYTIKASSIQFTKDYTIIYSTSQFDYSTNFNNIMNATTTLNTNLNNEITRSTNRDNALGLSTGSINLDLQTSKTNILNSTTTLRTDLTTEISNRQTGDNNLGYSTGTISGIVHNYNQHLHNYK